MVMGPALTKLVPECQSKASDINIMTCAICRLQTDISFNLVHSIKVMASDVKAVAQKSFKKREGDRERERERKSMKEKKEKRMTWFMLKLTPKT